MSATFIALYRGESVTGAKLLAITANPEIVGDLARRLLDEPDADAHTDPVTAELELGRRRALRLVRDGGDS